MPFLYLHLAIYFDTLKGAIWHFSTGLLTCVVACFWYGAELEQWSRHFCDTMTCSLEHSMWGAKGYSPWIKKKYKVLGPFPINSKSKGSNFPLLISPGLVPTVVLSPSASAALLFYLCLASDQTFTTPRPPDGLSVQLCFWKYACIG